MPFALPGNGCFPPPPRDSILFLKTQSFLVSKVAEPVKPAAVKTEHLSYL